MSQAAVQDELKTILRGLLISSPQALTVNELQKDYKLQEGQDVPFSKFGFKSFLEYIKSVPDTVAIQPSFRGGSPIVVPVQSDKSSHIDILVQKQKLQPPKRAYQSKFPRQRLSF
ncbi:tudor domain-containing protein 5 [Zootermopsis nevadensis]|uniref:tudor domain-containing protein 5 n=1 Tax=Zootermopsis nevadensis TaxID=136037 RepID=UPI000B8E7EEE|nr:tudor domain-containing protein 5 [Zootermopsis nevadensis]